MRSGNQFRVLHSLLVLMAVLMAQVPTVAFASTAWVASAPQVQVLSCARPDCDVLGTAYLGDALSVTGGAVNGYYPVAFGEGIGYVNGTFVHQGGVVPPFIEGDKSCKRVAFIFNIGIGDPPSASIIDTLVQQQVPATMFPMGIFARSEPEFLQRLDAEGFEIGTHGDQKLMLTSVADDAIRADVAESKRQIEAVIGRPIDPYFTAYAADTNARVRGVVSEQGYLPVEWRVPAADYADWATEDDVYQRVVNGVYPGAIVEFHLDGPATETSTAAALPRIIAALREQGYSFVTIGDMTQPCPQAPVGEAGTTATVVNTDGQGVRCRVTPESDGQVIAVIGEGSELQVRGADENGWLPVRCLDTDGWIHTEFLSLGSGTEPAASSGTTAVVLGTEGRGLKCRADASSEGDVIADVPEGTRVTVRGTAENGWVPVVCGGNDGWLPENFLVIDE